MRIRKDSQNYRANDPQRSAGRIACAMQDDTTALQISQGPPHRSRTVKGGTADCIGSSLTLPKSCLATFYTPGWRHALRVRCHARTEYNVHAMSAARGSGGEAEGWRGGVETLYSATLEWRQEREQKYSTITPRKRLQAKNCYRWSYLGPIFVQTT